MDEGGSESGGPASLSTKQLVYIAADIQKLQEQVCKHTKKIHIFTLFVAVYLRVSRFSLIGLVSNKMSLTENSIVV